MRGKCIPLLCTLIPVLLFILSPPAAADWNPGQPYKWLQAPDLTTTGIDIRVDRTSDNPRFVADDFLCTTPGPITDIHFWGSWLNDVKGRITKIHISINADIPDPDGSGPLFSQPGAQLWAADFTASQYTERLYKQLPVDAYEWWWDPIVGTLIKNGDQNIYQYNIQIDPKLAFVQQGTAANPKIYWLAISCDLDPQAPAQFGWKTRDLSTAPGGGHYQDDAVSGIINGTANLSTVKLAYPETHPNFSQSIDMAFVLTSPVYQPDMLIRTALDPLIGMDIYNTSGAGQTYALSVSANTPAVYYPNVQNDGNLADSFTVKGTGSSGGWTVKYFDATTGGSNITTAIVAGTWSTGLLAVGATKELRMEVTPALTVPAGASYGALVIGTSVGDATKKDAVKAVTTAQRSFQPDMTIRTALNPSIGMNIYNTTGAGQTYSLAVVANTAAVFYLKTQNDGNTSDSFTLQGTGSIGSWTVRYFDATSGGVDITADIVAGTWSTGILAVGATKEIRLEVTPTLTVPAGSGYSVLVTATSVADVTKKDAVKAVTSALKTFQPDMIIRTLVDPSIGMNIYNTTGAGQTYTVAVAAPTAGVFIMKAQNDGNVADSFLVKGPGAISSWTVTYFDAAIGGVDITADVVAGTWSTGVLAVGATKEFRVEMTPSLTVPAGASYSVLVTATSTSDTTKKDAVKGITTVLKSYQPDMIIRTLLDPSIGMNIYNTSGAGQTYALSVSATVPAVYIIKAQNDGNAPDSFTVKGTAGSGGWAVQYFDAASGGSDITAAIVAGTWSTAVLAINASQEIRVEVTPALTVPAGASYSVVVTATSAGNTAKKDAVKGITTALKTYQPDMIIRTLLDPSIGMNIYNATGVGQTYALAVPTNVTAVYIMKAQNHGNVPDTFTVKGPGNSGGWTVQYFDAASGGTDITADVVAGTWSTGLLAVNALKEFRVEVTPDLTVAPSASYSVLVLAYSAGDPTKKDAAKGTTTLVPFWNPGDPYKWLQMPDLTTTGMDIRVDNADSKFRIIADDFQCTTTGPIQDIHFWGSWRNDLKGRITKLHLSIYEDLPDTDGTGPLFSRPGKQLWAKDFTTNQFTERLYSQLPRGQYEWWWDLLTPELLQNGDTKVYQYNVQIGANEAFIQQGTAANPIIYWLAIQVELAPSAAAQPLFGWKTRDWNSDRPGGGHFNDDAVFGGFDVTGALNWNKLEYPTGHPLTPQSIDMSFVITTKPPTPKVQPDGWIRVQGGSSLGNNIYNLDGTNQTVSQAVPFSTAAIYVGTVQNDGNVADSFTVKGPGDSGGWTVHYFNAASGGSDITAAIVAGTWSTGVLAAGATKEFRVEVTPDLTVLPGTSYPVLVTITSVGAPTKKDAVLAITTLVPFWNPNDPYKWLQMPDISKTGMDIRVDNVDGKYRIIADDFQCTNTGPITDIHFWGSWLNDVKGRISKLHLSIYEDIPDPDGTGPLFSKPGNLLWTKDFSASQFTERLYQQLPSGEYEWWWDPLTQTLLPNGDTKVYQYNVQINPKEAFIQQGTASNPKIYWFSVQAELEPNAATQGKFGWKTRDWNPDHPGGGHFMDDAVFGSLDTTGGLSWNPLAYPPSHPLKQSIDMSFVITTSQPLSKWQPDGWISVQGSGYVGNDVYNLDGTFQNVSQAAAPGATITYLGVVQNDGNVADSFIVNGTPAAIGWTVKYFDALTNADITAQVTGAGWNVGPLAVGDEKDYRIEVTPVAVVLPGETMPVLVKATSVGDLTKLDVVKAVTTLSPFWNPDDPFKWLQMPDLTTTGMDIRVDNGDGKLRAIADDFQCTTTGPITDIHIWGSWLNDVKGKITKLRVSIFDDIPDPDGSGPLFSKPGTKLWAKDIWIGQFTERLYSQLPDGDYEWWWDLLTPTLLQNGDTKVYQYNMQIDPKEAFIQQGTAAKPMIYWLVVQAEVEPTTTTPMPQFGWKTRDWNNDRPGGGHFMDDAVFGSQDATGAINMVELKYPEGHPLSRSIDMAFVITTTQPSTYQPDGLISDATGATYLGNDIYNLDGTGQTIAQAATPGAITKYLGKVQNDGNVADSFIVTGTAGAGGWGVNYFDTLTGTDITAQMTGAGWNVGPLAVGETVGYRVEVTPAAVVPGGAIMPVLVKATSVADATKLDVVQALSTLTPDWNPGDPYKWLQMPDLTPTGMDIRVDNVDGSPRIIADDFQCTVTGPITDLHFWGSWLNDVKGDITKIHVSIYSDVPDSDGTGPAYSKPGTKLWGKDFNAGQFTERLYSQLPQDQHEWWWDLMIPNLLANGDTKVYQYNMQINPREAFIQQGTITNPKIYWLAIQVELAPSTTEQPQFGWKTRDPSVDHTGGGHFMDDAIFGSIDATGGIGMLQLKYPETHPLHPQSMDMAFVITTTELPKFQPDGWIGYQPVGTGTPFYIGDNIYNLDGTDQTISQAVVPGTTAKYLGIVQNDGNATDSFILYGSAGGDGWTVNYFDTLTNADITAQMTGAGWSVGPLAVGETKGYRVEVTPAVNVPGGSTLSVEIYATSVGDPTKQDVVKIDNVT